VATDPTPPVEFTSTLLSEFGRWARRALLVLMLVVIFEIYWVGSKVDRNYNGNPKSPTRQLVCAIAKDDAAKDPAVRAVRDRYCP
jgi:hypothetical protein